MSQALAARRGALVERDGLNDRQEVSRELTPGAGEASAQHEIQSAIVVARKFPRNEDKAYGQLMKSCTRLRFAEDSMYKFPRVGQNITGPSVNLAREGARCYGNIRYGVYVVSEDDDQRHIRGWAWDLETNTKVEMDDHFAKLVYRKQGGWQKPDERDLRELTNRRGAICVRNCILSVLPSDWIDDAMETSYATIKAGVSKNIDEHRKSIITAFGGIGVPVEELEQFLGHKLASCGPEEVSNLRQIYKSISDGNSKWSEYLTPAAPKGIPGPVKTNDLTGETDNQGAGPDELTPDWSALLTDYYAELNEAKTVPAVSEIYRDWSKRDGLSQDQLNQLYEAADARKAQIKGGQ